MFAIMFWDLNCVCPIKGCFNMRARTQCAVWDPFCRIHLFALSKGSLALRARLTKRDVLVEGDAVTSLGWAFGGLGWCPLHPQHQDIFSGPCWMWRCCGVGQSGPGGAAPCAPVLCLAKKNPPFILMKEQMREKIPSEVAA